MVFSLTLAINRSIGDSMPQIDLDANSIEKFPIILHYLKLGSSVIGPVNLRLQ